MDADAAPVVVGRYALFDRIAVGGMASVHLARQLGPIGFSRVVAVKRLHSQYVHDDAFVEMFVDEARLASRLRHPSVVSVTDVIETGEELLLVMDYVHGVPVSSLREAIARGAIPLPVVSSIVVDVLDGLQAAHDACDEAGQPLRIVHRDISPHNVLVGVDGIARIIDFGIAKATDRVQTTRDGQIKGKIRYMAPEQLSGDEVDARSDVYSAAVMLWELLSGRALVSQDDMGAMVRRVLFESLPRPRHPTERLSAELVAVTMRGLERAPDDRYATAAEMARALREAVEPAPREEVGAWLGEAASGTLEEHRSLLRRVELAPLPDSDGFAPSVGFVGSLPAGRDLEKGTLWHLHCMGAFAFGREDGADTASTEFYVALQPQRYLDRNLTVFGRVIDGMEHLQALRRVSPPETKEDDLGETIIRMRMASDSEASVAAWEILDSARPVFADFMEARRNRPESFFHYSADHLDVCQAPVPVRKRNAE